MTSLVKHILGITLLIFSFAISAADEVELDLRQISQQLVGAKLKALPVIIKQFETGGEVALPMLDAMLKGRLFIRKSDKLIVVGERQENGDYALMDALSAESLTALPKKQLKKVKVNNRLRMQLRDIIARVTLFSADPDIRESAVRNMLNKTSKDNIAMLEQAKNVETDSSVMKLIDLALAINVLTTSDIQAERLSALEIMDGSLEPIVFNTLSTLLAQDDAGNNLEADKVVREKALKLKNSIQQEIDFYELMEKLFFGLSLGSVLLLAATGLAITFGVMGVLNMAHGELIMIGAYTAYVVQLLMPNTLEYSILVAIPAAFLVAGAVGCFDSTRCYSFFTWPSTGNPISHVWYQPNFAASRTKYFLTPESTGSQPKLAEWLMGTQPYFFANLQPFIYFVFCPAGIFYPAISAEKNFAGIECPRGISKSRHGKSDRCSHRMGGCYDFWFRFRHCWYRRSCP